MRTKHFTATFTVDQDPERVFQAINDVRGWWSGEVVGDSGKLGDEFTYTVEGAHYSKQRVTEFVPGKKLVWHVMDARLDFVEHKDEWKGTDIVFDIARKGDKTELRFSHEGLGPDFECYEDCSNGWSMLVNGNLKKLIITGQHQPSPW